MVPLDTPHAASLSEMIRQSIRKAVLSSLQGRTSGAHGRKDVVGIQSVLDRGATLYSLSGKRANELVNADAASRRDMQCIIAGAIRPPHRLAAAGLVSTPECPYCGCGRCDAEHLFWQCPQFGPLRKPHLDAIHDRIAKVGRRSRAKATRLQSFIAAPCFRHCGLINGTAELSKALHT